MKSPSQAIEALYTLSGSDFDARFKVLTTNMKARLLEDFVAAPDWTHDDVEDLLANLSSANVQAQKLACQSSAITAEQKVDFETRLDNEIADAIIGIRDNYEAFGERSSVEFQLDTAKKLGIPVG